jgi:hypothetical protein
LKVTVGELLTENKFFNVFLFTQVADFYLPILVHFYLTVTYNIHKRKRNKPP